MSRVLSFVLASAVVSACDAGGDGRATGTTLMAGGHVPAPQMSSHCNGSSASSAGAGNAPLASSRLSPPPGFTLERIASVDGARELAALPNGDLLVGTSGTSLYIIPHAEAPSAAGAPTVFARLPEAPAAGVAFDGSACRIFIGTQNGVYETPYADGETAAEHVKKIASVRTGGSGGHSTTSVAFTNGIVYASVGSSCNACTESDPTRATIQQMAPSGAGMTPKATHIRNAIALAVNPATGTLWAGVAGQDSLPSGHPYEFFDAVSTRSGVVDYGWPACEENRVAYVAGSDCSTEAVPVAELPAYSTIIGAAFYPRKQRGTHAFPERYRGGAFIAAHGSWHTAGGIFAAPPRLVYMAMSGDRPLTPVDWNNPRVQWNDFVTGFQNGDGHTRNARPTGVAVGSQGSLFFADDQNGAVYRIRPHG